MPIIYGGGRLPDHKMLRLAFYALLACFIGVVAIVGGVLWWILPDVPSTARLRDVRFQTPLHVYTSDGSLIAEFGEKRRTPVEIENVPLLVKQAFVAAEDDRFYEHPGVDWMAIVRAGLDVVRSRSKRQGGSTITMQVARNFFLTPEKTYTRKLKEVVLAMRIERELVKDDILELYLNKIFLGQRAYGVVAAAQVYFGADLKDLSLPEVALIAGLPKAPSRLNPISNPQAALERRAYVLRRMLDLGFIDREAHDDAVAAPLTAKLHGQQVETSAPHLAEMVRAHMLEAYGDAAYTSGYRVFTTLKSDRQFAAGAALRGALLAYDRRHGYRGPEAHRELADEAEGRFVELLNPFQPAGGLEPALVTAVREHEVEALTTAGTRVQVGWDGLSWARRQLAADSLGAAPKHAAEVVAPGDVIRLEWVRPAAIDAPSGRAEGHWRLAQLPAVEGALVSLDSHDGAILALVGGFDFATSKFNRVTQALRQPGSNFKPFIYSAALDHGFTPASFINDAPIVFDAPGLDTVWRPENYTGTYYGPTRLRDALANSRNLVSIRLMRAIGIEVAVSHVSRFGFDPGKLPRNLSLSLGTGEITPLELAAGYAVFSNGGFRITPYFIQRIERADGTVVMQADPAVACGDCVALPPPTGGDEEPVDLQALIAEQQAARRTAPRAIDAQNAWLMYSMLKDVIVRGTGQRARALERTDLAGKTGTTNDLKDAWFSGFNGRIVTTTWVGFDQSQTLGPQETGARAALPMWIDYMRAALKDAPPAEVARPPGLVTVRIDPTTGLLAGVGNPRAIFETFREADLPKLGPPRSPTYGATESRPAATEQLF